MIVGASLLWIVMEVMACEIYLEREADDRTAAEIVAEKPIRFRFRQSEEHPRNL